MLTDREGLLGKTIRSHPPERMDVFKILSLRLNSLLGNPAVKRSCANKLIVPLWQSAMHDASGDKAFNLHTTIVQGHEHGMVRVCHEYIGTCLALTILTVVQDRSVVTIARAEVSKVEDLEEKQLWNGETRPQYSVILSPVDPLCCNFIVVQNCKFLSLPWTQTVAGEEGVFFSKGYWTHKVQWIYSWNFDCTRITDSIAVSVFFFHFHPGWYSSITFLMPRPATLCESYGLLGPMASLCDGLCGTTSHTNMATNSCTLVQPDDHWGTETARCGQGPKFCSIK